MDENTTTIMAALATLPPHQLSNLTHSIFSETLRRRRRLAALLSSQTLFSLSLRRLHSLSLHDKTLLIARHLLSSLRLLTTTTITTNNIPPIKARDSDAVLLLLHLCEVRQHNPAALETTPFEWRATLRGLYADTLLSFGTGIGVHNGSLLVPYIETVARCLRFVTGERKVGGDVAAAVSTVVALPSAVASGGAECAICREEMRGGREVCELPCRHLFHWRCVLPWLKKRNTCPCCRFQLPTDDVFGEIQRLWEVLIKMISTSGGGVGMKE
ncbi:43kDa postsynaptic protein [Parasponia andersonii]|uniref:RING-type E3 ubiquitin transferase n=1 Tax=Parasponia andersonii TaxID=3476 RepID=A0A2P5DHL1_PARAD|nr:43kDa postsynaptic protein [Parasponia andersonii]